jgi:phosphoglycerol geranylgeranyltransferase
LIGKIEESILKEIKKQGTLCFILIDTENISEKKVKDIIDISNNCGISGILIGGSTSVDQFEINKTISIIKDMTSLPVILFPGNITGISPNADAILFSSLLNSDNPYYIIQAQVLGAPLVKKYNLEAIPMGYIVIGEGGTIGFIGQVRSIPLNKPNIVAMYSLAAYYMGMRFIYLEAGSGVISNVTSQIVKTVRKVFKGIIIVGGGIKTPEVAEELSKSGADILIVGNLIEKKNFSVLINSIMKVLKKK